MTNPDIDDTILDRIRKVQGYLKSDNPNEAAVAAAKLSELLLKYNLELSDIPEKERPKDPFANTATDNEGKRLADWRITLASSIARANLCRIVISGSTIRWLGRQSNVEVAQYIYTTCADDLQRICDGLWIAIYDLLKQGGVDKEDRIHGKTWKADFLAGAANGVKQKLREEMDQWISENDNVNALITVNDRELANYVRAQYPSLGSRSSGSTMGGSAYGLGVNTGRNISFKTGIGAGGSNATRQIKG